MRIRKRVHESVVSGEAWASAVEKAVQYGPTIVSVLTMSGIGTWFAQNWSALSGQGWGVYPMVGALFALLLSGAVFLIALARKLWSSTKTPTGQAPKEEVGQDAPKAAQPDKQNPPLEILQGLDFTGKTVRIDGKHFIDCTFKQSTVRYDGGPYAFTHSHFKKGGESGRIAFTTINRPIAQALPILKAIGLLRDDAEGTMIEINSDDIQNMDASNN